MDERLAIEIRAFLDAHHVMSIATCANGRPHATSVFYARDGFRLVWTSDARTRHSREIDEVTASPGAIEATIAPDYADFPKIRGLQIAGTATRLAGEAAARARACMEARYGFLKALASGPPALAAAYSKATFYALEPSTITFIDNTKGFGHKATLIVDR